LIREYSQRQPADSAALSALLPVATFSFVVNFVITAILVWQLYQMQTTGQCLLKELNMNGCNR
jgi:hypothetical protein